MPSDLRTTSPVTTAASAAVTAEAALKLVDSRIGGLTSAEAAGGLAELGPNLVGVDERSLRAIVLEQVRNGINVLLAVAGALTIATDDPSGSRRAV